MERLNEMVSMPKYIDSILDSINCINVLISDEKGNIIQAQENFEKCYGCKSEDIIGRSVFELEQEGLFNPSSIAKVLETGKEVTLVQMIKNDKYFIAIAVPIKDEKDEIIRVVDYSTDIEGYFDLKQRSDELNKKIDYYNNEINELNKKQREIKGIISKKIISNDNVEINESDRKEKIMDGVITKNLEFKQILDNIQKVAKYNVNVLLLGETGVGKTMLAKKIHMLSNYSKGEFVEVNCGAIPHHLIESELFGYTKGSFTGASNDGKKGLLEIANKGTIFLDEISELPMQAQVKLLKILQDKTIRRIGGTTSQKIDCRIIAATNKDLEVEIENGNFRSDLFYRLNTMSINIPSLRNRTEDIPLISEYLLKKYNEKYNENKILSLEVIENLNKYNWPGNIRQLENLIQRLILTSDKELIAENILPEYIFNNKKLNFKEKKPKDIIVDLNKTIEEFEREIITTYFKKYKTSVKLAKALNISQTTAARKIRKYIANQ